MFVAKGGSKSEAYGHIKESWWGGGDRWSISLRLFLLPPSEWGKKREAVQNPRLTSLSLPSAPSSLFFPPFLCCCFPPRLNVTHPLTLELKSSPPPALLICSLHYSFITHLCRLCSACVSPFSLYPPRFRLTRRIFSPSGSLVSDTRVGVQGNSHETRDYKVARLTCVLQGATICLQGGAASVKRFPLLVKPKTADVFPCLQIFFVSFFARLTLCTACKCGHV